MASLGGDGLSKKLTNFTRVKVVDKTPHARFTPAGETLAKVGKLADSLVWVVVSALGRSSRAKHVSQKCGVPRFLISHKFDERPILGIEASIKEVLFVEDGKTIVEKIELDPFLV